MSPKFWDPKLRMHACVPGALLSHYETTRQTASGGHREYEEDESSEPQDFLSTSEVASWLL